MEYTTRMGSGPRRAHVNYQCPCHCIGGVIYNADKPLTKPGRCCCGRVLWVGPEARRNLEAILEPDVEWVFDFGSVTLPWGEVAETAMAWPMGSETIEVVETPAAERVRDPVCGMTIEPSTAAAMSVYRGESYYFCAPVCKTRFDASPRQFVRPAGLLDRLRKRT